MDHQHDVHITKKGNKSCDHIFGTLLPQLAPTLGDTSELWNYSDLKHLQVSEQSEESTEG